METRIESDALGRMEIPARAYYGIQTMRAYKNFRISGLSIHPSLIDALALVKKAAALVNMEVGMLSRVPGQAVVEATDSLLAGELRDEFILDPLQGGAGTSLNMNANEVLANKALELLGYERGRYDVIHPNNHLNMSQSTNDVVPTASRMAAIFLLRDLIPEVKSLLKVFREKQQEMDSVLRMGRTHLQDAVPIRLGQGFGAYAAVIGRDCKRLQESMVSLQEINMGATAVGTGLNADLDYIELITGRLSEVSGLNLKQGADLVDATQNIDCFPLVSSSLKLMAINLSKLASDLRLLSSGPRAGLREIILPSVQPGSSIMPGKVNPVVPEILNQISYQLQGNDLTISSAVEAGQLELNVMMPVIIFNLLQSLEIVKNGIITFRERCLKGIEANQDLCRQHVENSIGIITAINPHVGYDQASMVAKRAMEEERPLREIVLEEGLLTEEELDEILNPMEMTEPGIAGERLLEEE